jgi:hypothetical protein
MFARQAMNPPRMTQPPVAKAEMLIRGPSPRSSARSFILKSLRPFWFTHRGGPLEAGKVVQWTWAMYGFTPCQTHRRAITIVNSRFSGVGEVQTQQALGAAEGFTTILAGVKAWLENGIQLNLVADRLPERIS